MAPIVLEDEDIEQIERITGRDDAALTLVETLPTDQREAIRAHVLGERSTTRSRASCAARRRSCASASAVGCPSGASLSTEGETLEQHFAVVLDDRLLVVPYIDFRTYPDGIIGGRTDIPAGFTPQQARELSVLLRYGPLPVSLAAR